MEGMKNKPQIGWKSGRPEVWTLNNIPIDYESARSLWNVPGSADWSDSAFQAMAAVVIGEGKRNQLPENRLFLPP